MKTFKLSSIWIVVVLAALVIGGCAPATPAATSQPAVQPPVADTKAPAAPAPTQPPAAQPAVEKTTLSLISNWASGGTDPKGDVLKTILDDFMAANPDIEVTLEIVPDMDMGTKIETAFLGQQEPDLILQNWMGPSTAWLPDGVVIDLAPYLKEWGLEGKFKQTALKDYTVGDKVAALPIEGFNWPIWYNTEILEKAGVTTLPTTWDELKDAAKKIRAAGYQPWSIGGKDWTGGDWFLTAISASLGKEKATELFSKGGFSQSAEARAFVEAFVDLRDSEVFADNFEGLEYETVQALFFSGKAAMIHDGSWAYASLPKELEGKIKLGGVPLPPNSKGAAKPFWYSSYEGKGLWVTRNGSQKLEAIKKFAQFFFQDKYMAQFVEKAGMVHPFNELEYDQSVLPSLFVDSLDLDVDVVKPAHFYAPSNLYDAWYDVTKTAFSPGTSVDEILQTMDDLYK